MRFVICSTLKSRFYRFYMSCMIFVEQKNIYDPAEKRVQHIHLRKSFFNIFSFQISNWAGATQKANDETLSPVTVQNNSPPSASKASKKMRRKTRCGGFESQKRASKKGAWAYHPNFRGNVFRHSFSIIQHVSTFISKRLRGLAWTEQLPPTTHTGCSMPGSCPKAMTFTPWHVFLQRWDMVKLGEAWQTLSCCCSNCWNPWFRWKAILSDNSQFISWKPRCHHGLPWRRGQHFPALNSNFQPQETGFELNWYDILWVEFSWTYLNQTFLSTESKTKSFWHFLNLNSTFDRWPPHRRPSATFGCPPSAHPVAAPDATCPWPLRWSCGWCSETWPERAAPLKPQSQWDLAFSQAKWTIFWLKHAVRDHQKG